MVAMIQLTNMIISDFLIRGWVTSSFGLTSWAFSFSGSTPTCCAPLPSLSTSMFFSIDSNLEAFGPLSSFLFHLPIWLTTCNTPCNLFRNAVLVRSHHPSTVRLFLVKFLCDSMFFPTILVLSHGWRKRNTIVYINCRDESSSGHCGFKKI